MTTAQASTRDRLIAARTKMLDTSYDLRLLVVSTVHDDIDGSLVSALASLRQAIRRLDQAIDDLNTVDASSVVPGGLRELGSAVNDPAKRAST